MKKTGKFIACWLAVVLLAGFYMTMLVIGKNPDVGIEYRMYYITHELTDWPGYGNLTYDLGTVEYCTEFKDKNGKEFTGGKVCQRKGQGFKDKLKYKQYEGSESTGAESYIYYIPATSTDSAEYQFSINEFNGDGQIKVYANDKEIGTFESTGNYNMEIGSIASGELMTIKFVTDNCSFRLWTTCLNYQQ